MGRALTRRFQAPGRDVVALDQVDVEARAGTLTVVAGASGSGKSTLLTMLAAIDRPDDGTVYVGGTELTAMSRRARREWRRRHLGFVHATPADNLTDREDAVGNVVWAASLRGVELTREAAVAALAGLELDQVAGDDVHDARSRRELSGGEQQRLALACALAGDPLLVVADEPTASLDAASADGLVAVVRRVADAGTTLVVASHDPRFTEIADAVVRLEHGRRVA